MLIHQTEWNRLDIMDPETGKCLTQRAVCLRDAITSDSISPGTLPVYESKNYIDYFHSLLLVSPDDEYDETYVYRQLQGYTLTIPPHEDAYGNRILRKVSEVVCTAFTPDEYSQVHGELIWDATYECLIAITPNGTFALTLDGAVLDSLPACKCSPTGDLSQNQQHGRQYNPERHVLYHWSAEACMMEEQQFNITNATPLPHSH